MKEEKKIEKFEALISNEESTFLQESKEIIKDEEWLVASAGVIFMLLDFMESQTPKMKKKELAAELEVSPQYVGKLLRGEENLTLQTMTKIAHVMGMTFSELISDLGKQLSDEEIEEVPDHQFCHEERPGRSSMIQQFTFKRQFTVIAPSNVQTLEYSEEATYRFDA